MPQGNTLRAVAYGDELFVAVGQFGTIMNSKDGSNWVHATTYSTSYFTGVCFGSGLFVAVRNLRRTRFPGCG